VANKARDCEEENESSVGIVGLERGHNSRTGGLEVVTAEDREP